MNTCVKDYIVKLLEKKRAMPAGIDINDYRFIEMGHIDSLAVMNFMLKLEDQFQIELTDEDMMSDAFQSIGGLADIIELKISK